MMSAAALAADRIPQAADRFVVHVTPEMIRHQHILDALYFIGFAYQVIVLFVILGSGLSRRMRDLATRANRRPFVQSMIYLALLTLVTTLAELPLIVYRSYVVPHQFALTNQTLASWLGDLGKGVAVDIAIISVIGALALFAIRRFRRWWLVLWAGSLPLVILGVVATPLIIDPLFNHFTPLRDTALARDLLAEARSAGIDAQRVYEVDASKQTTTMNAYVTGLGPSKRIVLWDNLLRKLDHDEIIAVMGHEMGHYVMHHLWQGIAFAALVTFFGFWIAQWMYERWVPRWGERGDDATVPLLLAVAAILSFLFSPIYSSYSRHIEHQADKFAIDLTHLNEAAATSEVKFAEDSKVDPNPNAFIEFWRYSHPSAQKRIDFALTYRAGEGRAGGPPAVPPPARRR